MKTFLAKISPSRNQGAGLSLDFWLLLLGYALNYYALLKIHGISPPTGYELSLYTRFPWYVWMCLFLSVAIFILVTFRYCYSKGQASHPVFGFLGVFGVAVNVVAVIVLPYTLGYSSLRADFGSHLALSTEIAAQAKVSEEVFYPALFALIQVVHAVTGLHLQKIWFLGSALSYALYILVSYWAADTIFRDSRRAMFVGLAAAVPLAGAYLRPLYPASLSVHLLPLLYCFYLQSRRRYHPGFSLLLVFLSLLYPYLHPLTAMLGIAWLVVIEVLLGLLASKASLGMRQKSGPQPYRYNFSPALILGISWFVWISSFTFFENSLREVTRWFLLESRTQLSRINYLIDRTNFTPVESAFLIFKQENGLVFYVALSLLAMGILISTTRLGKYHKIFFGSLILLLLVSICMVAFGLVGPFGGLDFYRFSRFLVPWATLGIAAVPIAIRRMHPARQPFFILVVYLIVVITAIGGFLALHPSPYTFLSNDQVTIQEINCMKWTHEHAGGRPINGILSIRNLAIISLGHSIGGEMRGNGQPLPDHFGYPAAPYIKDAVDQPTYIIITEHDRRTVLDLWSRADKFTLGDFTRLRSDPTAELIYQSDQCEVWRTID